MTACAAICSAARCAFGCTGWSLPDARRKKSAACCIDIDCLSVHGGRQKRLGAASCDRAASAGSGTKGRHAFSIYPVSTGFEPTICAKM